MLSLNLLCFHFALLCIFSEQASTLLCSNQQLESESDLDRLLGPRGIQIRECICEISESKPCIPFCCPPGEIKKKDFARNCELYEHEVYLNTSNQIGYVESRIEDKFRIVDGRACSRSFYLIDEIDSWILLEVCYLWFLWISN